MEILAESSLNPILLLRGTNAVGNKIELDSSTISALVISGPNAGGKTIVLKTAGLLGLGVAGAGLFNKYGDGPKNAQTAQVSAIMDPAKELVNRLESKYGSVIRTPDFTITSIIPHGNAISFKGHSEEERNFPPMGDPKDILEDRIRKLISLQGKIENFKITIERKMEKCLDKNDKSDAKRNIFVAANEFARKTGGELEIKQDGQFVFYFINYRDGSKINYLSHGQVGAMANADLKDKFGEDVSIIRKPSNDFEFMGSAFVSN
jgi:hypothetical protein